MRTLIVVPTYNERENLPPLVDAVLALDPDIDVLVVDDNSPDGTGALADALAQATGRVHVLHRAGKQGYATAHVAAFRYALAREYARAGLRMVEVPIVFPDRVRGESKMSSRIVWEAAGLVLRLRLRREVALPAPAAALASSLQRVVR